MWAIVSWIAARCILGILPYIGGVYDSYEKKSEGSVGSGDAELIARSNTLQTCKLLQLIFSLQKLVSILFFPCVQLNSRIRGNIYEEVTEATQARAQCQGGNQQFEV